MEQPVFEDAWQAQAFAMVTLLQNGGYITPFEWTEALGREIAASRARGEPDDGSHYYHQWLAALERIVSEKGLITNLELDQRKQEWEEAARATPHGQPIVLRR